MLKVGTMCTFEPILKPIQSEILNVIIAPIIGQAIWNIGEKLGTKLKGTMWIFAA